MSKKWIFCIIAIFAVFSFVAVANANAWTDQCNSDPALAAAPLRSGVGRLRPVADDG